MTERSVEEFTEFLWRLRGGHTVRLAVDRR